MTKLGFIGMGNMAKALFTGFIASGKVRADEVTAFAPDEDKLKKNAEALGFVPEVSLRKLVKSSGIIIMACKPCHIEGVLGEIGDLLDGKALVSVALGWDFKRYKERLGDNVKVQFVMPNTPASVGEGVFLFEEENSLSVSERKEIKELFASAGIVEELPSSLMKIGGVITGCGPAFADIFIEAYADSAVKYGIPRKTAYRLVSKTVKGAAALQLETGEHPGVLKDKVCSPGGSTIRGIAALEKEGLRRAAIASVDEIMGE